MKKLIAFIPFFIFFSTSAQNFLVSADKNNVLYIGVDNPLSIIVENYSSSQILVKADRGHISSGYGHTYMYNGSDQEPGPVSIILYNRSTSKEFGRSTFRLKYIPDPVAKVGPSAGGNIYAVVLKNQQYIRAELENFDFNAMFGIDSFTINIIRTDTCYFKEVINIGNKFGSEVIKALEGIKKNDIVIFKKIYALGPDGRTRILSPIIFTVTE